MLFQPFKKATRPETPGFADAELQEGVFKQKAKQQANALRSQNMLGAATIYNEATPDTTPISDYMFGVDEVAPSVAEAGVGSEALGAADVGAASMGVGGAPMAGAVPLAAPTAMTAGGAGGMAGVGAAAPVAGGAAPGVLASMGPGGWAALAGLALMNL